MPRVINITDKLSNEKPMIIMGDNKFFVNNSMGTLFKFEELTVQGTKESLTKALGLALGEKDAKKIKVEDMSIEDFKVLNTAIMACMQNMTYEEAEERFRKKEEPITE